MGSSQAQRPYSYDEVPYPSNPFPQSHPDRLAAIATLFGMRPRRVDRCRVLELGCGRGGNLIPMAEQFPQSHFVGIELSEVQLGEAQDLVTQTALDNIELRRMNLLDVGLDLGEFDYIIAHGVYSWVEAEVQQQILAICRRHLAPQGVAYVSYNTYPGWNMRGMIRDIMCYHAGRFDGAPSRLQQGRALLDFLAQHTPDDQAYGMLLKTELEMIKNSEDAYLYHDHFEEVNQPIYFHEFNARLEEHQLQYMGESDAASMYAGHLPAPVLATFQRIATNLIQMEQYMDFVKNRTFRQTLLCHADVSLNRELQPSIVQQFHVASPLVPDSPSAAIRTNQPVKFQHRFDPRHAFSTVPVVKGAMFYLAEIWPANVSFLTLAQKSLRLATADAILTSRENAQLVEALGKLLLEWYLAGMIELQTQPSRFALTPSTRPAASRVARRQALTQNVVTTLRHERCSLSEFNRLVIRELNGSQDFDQLTDKLLGDLADGTIVLPEGVCGTDDEIRSYLATALRKELDQLARAALLLPDQQSADDNLEDGASTTASEIRVGVTA